ncbi:MAG: hypothetical protein JNK40_11680 [Chromatiales bacterium]|nr:hypothetical protein [Chromatiales bacterium]
MNRAAGALIGATLFLAGCVAEPTRSDLMAGAGPLTAVPVTVVDGRARFREIFCGVLADSGEAGAGAGDCAAFLWRLADEPDGTGRSLPTPDHAPQVYIVTGAFSECLGEEARPFNGAAARLRAAGYRLATIVVSGRSGTEHNARQIADRLEAAPPGEAGPAVLIGYSKGANDILEFLVRYPALAARVKAVVSVAGAIGGTPVTKDAAGIYDTLLRRIPSGRCAPGDGQVINSLAVETRREWLNRNPLPDHVRYYSVAAFATREQMSAILVPVWRRLLRYDLHADGQLLARDALIPGSTLLGYLNADHWSAAIDVETVHPLIGSRPDDTPFPRDVLLAAILLRLAEWP